MNMLQGILLLGLSLRSGGSVTSSQSQPSRRASTPSSSGLLRGGTSSSSSSFSPFSPPADIAGFDDNDNFLCDESYPLAPPPSPSASTTRSRSSHGQQYHQHDHDDNQGQRSNNRKLSYFAIPDDSTGRSYAPLCIDARGVRRLQLANFMMCNSGSCYNEYYEQCTFECSWSPPTPDFTKAPSSRPTKLEDTDNHVLLKLEQLAEDYRLSAKTRQSIIDFIQALLLEHLGYNLEIDSIEYPGRLPGQPHSLPMEVVATGPSDVSDFALSYILDMLRDKESDLVKYLEMLDGGEPFANVGVVVETYDPNDIVSEPSDPPSISPTASPISEEVAAVMAAAEVEEDTGIPWWIWLIVALVAVCIILCCFWYFCTCCGKEEDDEEVDKDGQAVNIYMQNNGDNGKDRQQQRSRSVARRDSFGDAASRYTSRTSRSRKTQSTRRTKSDKSRKSNKSRSTIVSRSFTQKHLPKHQESDSTNSNEGEKEENQLIGVEAVSVLLPNEGFDPDGLKVVPKPSMYEPNVNAAVVPYASSSSGAQNLYPPISKNSSSDSSRSGGAQNNVDVGGSGNLKQRQSRDPTMYIPENNGSGSGNGQRGGRGGGGGRSNTDSVSTKQRQSRDPTMYIPEDEDYKEPEGALAITDGNTSADGTSTTRGGRNYSNNREKRSNTASEGGGDFGDNKHKSSLSWKRGTFYDEENSGDDPSEYNLNPNRMEPPSPSGQVDDAGEDPSIYTQDPTRMDPEAPTSDQVEDCNHNNTKKKKKKNKHSSTSSKKSSKSRRSSRDNNGDGGEAPSRMDRIRRSLSWKRDTPLDIDFSIDNSEYESPSMMTNPNVEQERNYDDSDGREPSSSRQKKSSMYDRSGGVESLGSFDV